VTYFTAGSAGMSYWRFIFWDGLAALLSAPVFVWLGFHFGGELDYVFDRLKDGQVVVFGALAVLGVGFFLWRRRSAARNAQKAEVALSPVAAHLLPSAETEEPAPAPLFDVADSSAAQAERANVRD
jgi:hypothetical protein